VENEYGANHRCVPVIKPESVPSNNLFPSATASASCQSSCHHYDLYSDDEEYFTPTIVAKTAPRQSNHTARLLTVVMLSLTLVPESQKDRGQVNLNLNDYHSHPMEISITFSILDITDWW